MKNFTLTFIAVIALSIATISAQENRAETIQQFAKDIPALSAEKVTSVAGLINASTKKATKTIELTQENMSASLKEAAGKTCILVVENHTFVKFTDTKKCSFSGSWNTCMPYGEGYIVNGGLKPANDYINNIIGKPDSKKRTLFIF